MAVSLRKTAAIMAAAGIAAFACSAAVFGSSRADVAEEQTETLDVRPQLSAFEGEHRQAAMSKMTKRYGKEAVLLPQTADAPEYNSILTLIPEEPDESAADEPIAVSLTGSAEDEAAAPVDDDAENSSSSESSSAVGSAAEADDTVSETEQSENESADEAVGEVSEAEEENSSASEQDVPAAEEPQDETQSDAVTAAPAYTGGGLTGYTQQEFDMMCSVVMAEVGYCDETMKLAISNVIINRVRSDRFPDTIYEVLHQQNQFTAINNYYNRRLEPDEDTIGCVRRALAGEGAYLVNGATFYYTPGVSSPAAAQWFENLCFCAEVGNGRFFKAW